MVRSPSEIERSANPGAPVKRLPYFGVILNIAAE
jgi:hypothetical protein